MKLYVRKSVLMLVLVGMCSPALSMQESWTGSIHRYIDPVAHKSKQWIFNGVAFVRQWGSAALQALFAQGPQVCKGTWNALQRFQPEGIDFHNAIDGLERAYGNDQIAHELVNNANGLVLVPNVDIVFPAARKVADWGNSATEKMAQSYSAAKQSAYDNTGLLIGGASAVAALMACVAYKKSPKAQQKVAHAYTWSKQQLYTAQQDAAQTWSRWNNEGLTRGGVLRLALTTTAGIGAYKLCVQAQNVAWGDILAAGVEKAKVPCNLVVGGIRSAGSTVLEWPAVSVGAGLGIGAALIAYQIYQNKKVAVQEDMNRSYKAFMDTMSTDDWTRIGALIPGIYQRAHTPYAHAQELGKDEQFTALLTKEQKDALEHAAAVYKDFTTVL